MAKGRIEGEFEDRTLLAGRGADTESQMVILNER